MRFELEDDADDAEEDDDFDEDAEDGDDSDEDSEEDDDVETWQVTPVIFWRGGGDDSAKGRPLLDFAP